MDFSNLLSKKLEEKRKKQQKAKGNAQTHKIGSSLTQPIPSGNPKDIGERDTDERNINERNIGEHGDLKQNQQNQKQPETNHTPSQNTEEAQLLNSIDNRKLQESLRLFNESNSNESKEHQLRKLQLHVKHEKKDLRYKQYLDRENGVQVHIQLQDIGSQKTDKLCLQIRKFFKEILATWTSSCDSDFPESMLMETKRDIVKLLYKLRSHTLSSETVVSLSTIVYYIQTENIVKANEAYLQLSIGNVAWPIGVRDVGIHARAADAKIAGDDKTQLSNIMKSEATRRWLISVKRIVNYCEKLHAKKAQ
ncbi:hypothetical protein JCM33374_g2870 [Metschnikowia sp. JCM 33374]|nr:hypothetical protein JCM33374_g2870 [Metschnikowia sp. JCM 33374]